MSRTASKNAGWALLALLLVAAAIWWLTTGGTAEESRSGRSSAAVAVAPVEKGTMERRRTFTGTLSPRASFDVAPKVDGRLESVRVDLGDAVERGDIVALIDDEELRQTEQQAQADLAVAVANEAAAESSLEIAQREIQRATTLRERGVTSDSQFDETQSNLLAAEARLEVAIAQKTRAESALASVRIRLGYTAVTATWSGAPGVRVVAERFLDAGETVSANQPLLRIVQLDPLTAVVAVTERDYPFLHRGQSATLTTDAYPGETFEGTVSRLAPVFAESTRQARVELEVDNADLRLKPGLFVRVSIVLEAIADATIVPEAAITQRDGVTGVFLLDDTGAAVKWVPVTLGVREAGRVQIVAPALRGRVVTLGQQLLDDGMAITIPQMDAPTEAPGS